MLKINEYDRKKLIDPLYKTSPQFWALITILLLILSWGAITYIRQVTNGLVVTGMQRPVYWGTYMVNFIFFIGISHAGTLISAILRVVGAEWRRPITRVAEAITAFALIVGTLQIIIDMGRPDRFFSVLLHGRLQSPLLWDAVSVTAYFLGSITYLYLPLIPDAAILRDNFPENGPKWRKKLYTILSLGWRGNKTQWIRLEKAIGVMAILIIPIAISVHTIISWILATTVQPGWHSTIFGPYFVVGAIFSGIGALFIAMTIVRKVWKLEKYFALKQYKNLGMIFIVMTITWMYFTWAEHLTLAAGQEVNEFPVLASKLWGEFSVGFWLMVGLMVFAFWVMVAPQFFNKTKKIPTIYSPKFLIGTIGLIILVGILLVDPTLIWDKLSFFSSGPLEIILYIHLFLAIIVTAVGLAHWYKTRPIDATVVAAIAVVIGMWLERWNIIIPTLTHPYLVAYSSYRPSATEISLTVASLALFVFLFVIFFKIFPVVSIWEVAEGRVIDKAAEAIHIPLPTPVNSTTPSGD
jgi:Ni/Fe-hydrogenase subunit HybB-like protein